MTTPARLRPQQALEAAGYIRVSLERQAEGFSPDVQRDAIKRLAAEQGYALTMIEEDHARGSNVSREGYQRIIEAVRAGTIHAVLVFMFDRWGRDGAEWLTRAREFERLDVPIISVQEGRDEGGLMRFMRAGMAEEYSRQLAKRVKPSRERAARSGTHMGCTPLGYERIYPAHVASGHHPPAELVVDEATAWIVREMFTRYAGGGWSLRSLALWLNTDPRVGLTPTGKPWRAAALRWILTNPTYKGAVRYNHHSEGLYERARDDEVFIVDGRHEGLVDPELWDTVQHRLTSARSHQTRNMTHTHAGNRIALAAGILVCTECGTHLYLHRRTNSDAVGMYTCMGRRGGTACTLQAYSAPVADAALLAEIRRLRGAPWTPQREMRLLGPGGKTTADAAAATARALETERERLRKHTRLMSLLDDDPTPEQIATFREVSSEISGRIRAMEAQLAVGQARAAAVPDLRRLHLQLTQTEWATVIAEMASTGDVEGLRAIVVELVTGARLVERRPERHCVWARMEVTWAPDVQLLLDAGLLWLDAPPEPPYIPTSEELRRAKWHRGWVAKKAKRQREREAAT